jgi:hypothetical protein
VKPYRKRPRRNIYYIVLVPSGAPLYQRGAFFKTTFVFAYTWKSALRWARRFGVGAEIERYKARPTTRVGLRIWTYMGET